VNPLTLRRICDCASRISPVVGAAVPLHRLWLVRKLVQKFVSILVLWAATTKTSAEAPNTSCNRQIRSEDTETKFMTRVQHTMICFPISGCLTASAKHGTGLMRATCSRKDGTAPDCKRTLRKCCDTDRSLGRRGLNEKDNWRRVELRRRK
jgi:hypothetical protein